MQKKTTKTHLATKSRASSTKRRPVKSTAKTRKVVAPKGVAHHAKRLYHLTPKFVHGMVVGGLIGVLVVSILGGSLVDPLKTSAATGSCDAHGIGDHTLTHSTNNSAYTINGNQTTVTFDVVGKNCKLPVTMVVWKAPNGTTGKPYSQQTLFFHTSGVFSEGRHKLTGTLPGCYFQVDTVTGTKLTGSTGQAYNYDTRQVAFMHGGSTSCTVAPTTTTPTTPTPTPVATIQVCDLTTHEIVPIDQNDFDASKYSQDTTVCQQPETAPAPTPTPQVETAATTLPNTGPGAVLIIFGLSILGGYAFHMRHRHVQHKKRAAHHSR